MVAAGTRPQAGRPGPDPDPLDPAQPGTDRPETDQPESSPPGPEPEADADPGPAEQEKLDLSALTGAGAATVAGAAAGSLGLTWVLYERVLPFSGALGFWLCWTMVFLLLYAAMARLQWDRREAVTRLIAVAVAALGLLTVVIVLGTVAFVLVRGWSAVRHLNFFTQSMALAGPTQPLSVGGVLHAIVGTLEQLGLATAFSVPLGLACALFLAEVGGPLARPVRTIVEAMTALPDIIAGLFVFSAFLLTLGLQSSGLAAGIALSVNMLPIVARASEVVLRLVPGTLREASYALGASQWRTAIKVVLPTARSGLATAVVLGMARAIGETAPVLLVSGVSKYMNFDPFSGPQISLPLYIYNYALSEASAPPFVTRAFGAAVALMLVVLVLFTLARRIGGTAPGQLTQRQRRRIAQTEVRA